MALAINGGQKAVTVEAVEQWQPPYDELCGAANELIRRDALSGDWEKTYFRFEDEFKNYIGTKYACAFNTGTTALWGAYYALGIKPDDEVICPSYTWVSTISPAVHMGARPVFCELEENKVVADPADIEKRITQKTKAIVVVHLFGNIVNMDAVMAISKKYGIPVIEDCSHCHGAEWNGKKCGSIGDIGCFSMQGNAIGGKALPAGEGGIIVTDSQDLYSKIIFYTQMNRPYRESDGPFDEYAIYGSERCGMKFRAHPIGLTLASVLFKSLDACNAKKTAYRNKVNDAIKKMPQFITIENDERAVPGGFYGGMQFIYKPETLGGLTTKRLIEALKAEGVSMKYRDYQAMHTMPLYQQGYDLPGIGNAGIGAKGYAGAYYPGCLPVTERVLANMVGMPVFIEEPAGYFEQMIVAFDKVISNYKELLS